MPVSNDHIEAAKHGMTWEAYMELFTRLVAEGRTTGADQSQAMLDYTKLNLSRTRRWNKTLKILPELEAGLAVAGPQTWLVLTECWCGDAAQCNPIITALAERTPGITLRFILRDEHLPIMDQHLTNGGRSIPKLIAWDGTTKQELFSWGPRPAAAQKLYDDYLATPPDQRDAEAMKEQLHRWYFDDAGISVQRELLAFVGTATRTGQAVQ